MDIWTISDLHLGPGGGKGHFSSKWVDHQPKMRKAWDAMIDEESIVLMPGDFSWNQTPEDLWYDYSWMDDRPGKCKVMTAGNHDYGVWSSRDDIHKFCNDFDTLEPLLGEATRIENPYNPAAPGIVIGGTIGSMTPEDHYYDSKGGWSKMNAPSDEALLVRELHRLERAVSQMLQLRQPGDTLIMMLHYPPFADQTKPNVYADVLEAAGVDVCLYGHLHQKRQWPIVRQGVFGSVDYRFVGADFLEWEPIRLGTFTEEGFSIDRIRRHAAVYWKWNELEKKWDGWVETHDPKKMGATEVVKGSRHAKQPPPTSDDWDENSGHFNISMSDFDPVGLFVGFPEQIRGWDGKKRADEPCGPYPMSKEDLHRFKRRLRKQREEGRRRHGRGQKTIGFAGQEMTVEEALEAMKRGVDHDGDIVIDVTQMSDEEIDMIEEMEAAYGGGGPSPHRSKKKPRHIPTAMEIINRISIVDDRIEPYQTDEFDVVDTLPSDTTFDAPQSNDAIDFGDNEPQGHPDTDDDMPQVTGSIDMDD